MELHHPGRESIPPPIQPRGFFTGVEIRPIITGAVVDYVVSIVLFVLYLAVYFPRELLEKGGWSEEALEKALNDLLASPQGLWSLAIIGALGTALGGYVAGRLAKTEKIKHGALVGFVSLVLGILLATMTGGKSSLPDWYEIDVHHSYPGGRDGRLLRGMEWPSSNSRVMYCSQSFSLPTVSFT